MTSTNFADDPARGCAPGKVNPDLFFADSQAEQNEAKKICHGCPVRAACDTYATTTGQEWGIWAGINRSTNADKMRRRKHRRTRQAVAA